MTRRRRWSASGGRPTRRARRRAGPLRRRPPRSFPQRTALSPRLGAFWFPARRTAPLFATLSDGLSATFRNLRGKGRLSEADIDATAREIRIALLEADVALPVVKEFVAAVK